MSKWTSYLLIIFAFVVLSGGFLGFVRAKSLISLIVGVLFFVLLFLSGLALVRKKEIGVYLAPISSVSFFLLFMIRFVITKSLFPAMIMLCLSLPIVIASLYNLYQFCQVKNSIES